MTLVSNSNQEHQGIRQEKVNLADINNGNFADDFADYRESLSDAPNDIKEEGKVKVKPGDGLVDSVN